MAVNYIEYGKENEKVMIFLHGGGLSWWNHREIAKLLQRDYRIILPILDGHSGSGRDFTTIEANADDILTFIEKELGGSVLLMGGVSLGGQILLEILARRPDICKYAIIESALVMPSKLTHALIRPMFGSCYGLIRKRWFAKLQFQYLRIKPDYFEDYYRDTCAVTKENMIAFLEENSIYEMKKEVRNCQAKVHILVVSNKL